LQLNATELGYVWRCSTHGRFTHVIQKTRKREATVVD